MGQRGKTGTAHLAGLDGLRGAAAILVMLHHDTQMVPAGFLAVDFFFMLSGFVIARAYDDRLRDGLSVTAFMRLRLARLYPVMAIGIMLGAVIAFAGGMSGGELATRFAAQMLFIPIPRGTLGLYILDGVQWSLFFELVANLLHATLLWRLGRHALARLAVIAFLALLVTSFVHGSIGVGDRGSNMAGGIPRVMFSYLAGVLMYRLASIGRLPWIPLSGRATLAAFLLVLIGAGQAEFTLSAWWLEPLIVLTVFPLLLASGAQITLSPHVASIARFGGRISYPLYALHLPVAGAVNLALTRAYGLNAGTALILTCAISLSTAVLVGSLLDRSGRSGRRNNEAGARRNEQVRRPWSFMRLVPMSGRARSTPASIANSDRP